VAKRKVLYGEIQRRRMAALATLPLYYRDRVGVVTADLLGYTASNGIIPEWNAWHWSKP
jgi:hypothetical protein